MFKFWLSPYNAVQSNKLQAMKLLLIVLFLHKLLNPIYADNALHQLFSASGLQEHFHLLYASSKCESKVE